MNRLFRLPWFAALLCTAVVFLAAYWLKPTVRPYLPIALSVPALCAVVAWRRAANDVRLRAVYDAYAFREIVRRERRRLENW